MADAVATTLPNYPAATTLNGSELVPVWQNNKQCAATADQLLGPGLTEMDNYISQAETIAAGIIADTTAAGAAQVALATNQAGIATTSANVAAAAAAATGILYTSISAGATPPYKVSGINIGAAGTATANGRFNGAASGLPGFTWSYLASTTGGISAPMWPEKQALSTSSTAPTLSASAGGASGATVTATMSQLANGETFWALSADGQSQLLWQVSGGVAAAFNGTDGKQVATPLQSSTASLIGTPNISPAGIAASGSSLTGTTCWYWPTVQQNYDQWLDTLQIPIQTTGSIKIIVATVVGGNTLTLVSSTTITIGSTGLQTLSGLGIYVPAGAIVGVQMGSAAGYYTNGSFGGTSWSTTGVPTTGTSVSTSTTVGPHFGLLLISETIYKSRYAYSAVGAQSAQGVASPGVASGNLNVGNSYIQNTPFAQSGTLETINIYAASAQLVTLFTCTLSGPTASLVASQQVQLQAGLNQITTFNPTVAAGQYLGVYTPTGSSACVAYASTGGSGLFSGSGLIGASTTVTSSGLTVFVAQINWRISSGLYALIAGLSNTIAALQATTTIQGAYPAVNGSGNVVANRTSLPNLPISTSGRLGPVSLYCSGAGSVTLYVVTVSAGVITAITAAQSFSVSSGLNTIMGFNPPVQAGQYLAVHSSAAIVRYLNGGVGFMYSDTAIGVGGSVTTSGSSVTIEIGWQVFTGTTARIAGLESDNEARLAGIGLLNGADATGAIDATQLFASARASHPTPNVPAGTFSLNSIPYYGEGFWGAGKVQVGGVTLALPERPERGSRYLKMRAALVSQIMSGSCAIICGDSISSGYNASSKDATWVSLLTRFANLGIAVDEPVMVNFDGTDSNNGPAFQGLTFASPSTITNGSNGPLGLSLMLQPGQSVSMTGAYERIDVTYTGVASGTLVFAYNGTTYATVNTTSSGSDLLAGAGATGQTASGTYSITNSGSVAVEITSLIRLGVKVAGTPNRLYVCRIARGGCAHSDYTSARITSAVRIATAVAGGTNHFLIPALGTNDQTLTGLSYATEKANVTTFINNWVSAGVPVTSILPVMPWRWGSYVSSGGNFEVGNAAIRDAYKAAGVSRFVQTDGVDFKLQGLTISDGHPNDAGMLMEFNLVVGALAAF